MNFPFILMLFIFLTIAMAFAWWGKRKTAIFLFCIFLILAGLTFWHHISDSLNIQL